MRVVVIICNILSLVASLFDTVLLEIVCIPNLQFFLYPKQKSFSIILNY